MLLQLPDILTPDDVQSMRTALATAPWVDGTQSAGPQAAQVKHNWQLPFGEALTEALQARVLAALERQPLFFSAALPKRIYPPQFNRYAGESNTYGNHVDNAVRFVARTETRVRADLSCTLFLTEPNTYDGGELVIEHNFGCERVKLPAGHLVLYPASSVHRVEPVTRGERLASFFWIESLVRRDDQRRLLFDLDTSLIRLRNEHGDTNTAVALTGTYHNLLRMWADT